MTTTADYHHKRARLARASMRDGNMVSLREAQRDFCEAKLTRDIEEAVERWGPLKSEQRARLAALVLDV